MKLVMVHGRGQAGKDPGTLRMEWADALEYGLLRASKRLPAGTQSEFPFYGDELEKMVQQTSTPLSVDAHARGTQSDAEQEMRGEMLEDLAFSLGLTRADIEREYAGQPQEKGPQNWEWVQAILRAVDRIPGINSSAINAFTRGRVCLPNLSGGTGKDRTRLWTTPSETTHA